MSTSVLNIENLEVRYAVDGPDVLAVAGLSLALQRGETYGLVGESGSGKSSVAMAIMRHLGRRGRIAAGSICFNGLDLAVQSKRDLRRLRGRRIAMIYQDPATALNPSKRIGAQLVEVLKHHGVASSVEARRRVLDSLRDVHLADPETILRRYPYQISGGQQQRVIISMAFLAKPELLLLDEPTSSLDVTVERGIIDLLVGMQRSHGTTALFISHNLALVRQICSRVGVMYGGQIVEEGPADVLFADPHHPYTRGLLACLPRLDGNKRMQRLHAIAGQAARLSEVPSTCTFLARCERARSGLCDAANPRLEPAAPGSAHLLRCFRPDESPIVDAGPPRPLIAPPPEDAPQPVLRVDSLTKRFGLPDGREIVANNDLSLALFAGETVAVVGESGSGKSTLGRILIGLEVATEGKVILGDTDVGRFETHRRSSNQIRAVQMIFQNPDSTLNPAWTVGAMLKRALARLGDFGSRKQRAVEMWRLLAQVRLPAEVAGMLPSQLSGGQKQRVAIARAFAGRPSIVIADEPTSALDTSVKTAIIELLLATQQAYNTALLFMSHDLGIVRYIADRVIVMHAGEIVEIGPADAVFAPPYHPYTEALLTAVPVADTSIVQRRIKLHGEAPSLLVQASGCGFASRCPRKLAGDLCDRVAPPLRPVATGHAIRCHIPVETLCSVPPVFLPAPQVSLADARSRENLTP